MPEPSPISPADGALAWAIQAWHSSDPNADVPILRRYAEPWRQRIWAILEAEATGSDAEERRLLAPDHGETVRPDPDRIHPSWWVRAAQDESPAVRRAVAAHASPKVAAAVRASLGPDLGDPPTRTPDAAALRWALCLFAERLVGGVAPVPSDPPVVRAMAAGRGASLLRLVRSIALAKLAYAEAGVVERGSGPDRPPLSRRESERFEAFLAAWTQSGTDTRLVRLALWDAEDRSDSTVGRVRSSRGELSRLGVTSLARVLSAVEPTRARWALQHLPYELAKVIRSRMNLKNPLVSGRGLLEWERALWRVAARRLESERGGAGP